jgi:hypothetical protein
LFSFCSFRFAFGWDLPFSGSFGDGRVLYWTSLFDVGGAIFCFPGHGRSGSIDIRSSFLIHRRGGSATFAAAAFSKVWSYAWLVDVVLLGLLLIWPSCRLWWPVKRSTPPSANFLVWATLLPRCWMSERLQRHGLRNSEPCVLCHQALESIEHLLLNCVYAREVWLSGWLSAAMPGAGGVAGQVVVAPP